MRAAAPLLAALVLAGAACSTSAAGEGPQVERTAGSEPEASLEEVEVDSTARSARTTDDSNPGTVPAPPHPVVTDNRVYVVGDSISESIASRYSGLICEALGPLGWDVVVDAVQGRRTDQAIRSLRRNQTRVGQTVMVLIGHNDGIDPEGYREHIEQLIDLVPDARRILLLTNYEFERGRDRMNDVLREMAAADGDGGPDDRLQLVDWNAAVEEIDDAIQRDGIHLTDSGQRALVTVMAAALGAGPDQDGLPGEPSCTTLRDSIGSSGSGGSGSGGSGGSGRTTTTPAQSGSSDAPPATEPPPATDAPPATDGPQPTDPPPSEPPSGTGQGQQPPNSNQGGPPTSGKGDSPKPPGSTAPPAT